MSRPRSGSRRPRRLVMEALEDRRVLSGVSIEGNVLVEIALSHEAELSVIVSSDNPEPGNGHGQGNAYGHEKNDETADVSKEVREELSELREDYHEDRAERIEDYREDRADLIEEQHERLDEATFTSLNDVVDFYVTAVGERIELKQELQHDLT